MDANSLSPYDGSVLMDNRLTLLGDGAQTVDMLGYQPYVDATVEVLAQKELQTPFAVGVFGRWGTGKSTFMNLLHVNLSRAERRKRGEDGGFHCVWFQPWQFEQKEEVWKALLLSVIRYLEVVHAENRTEEDIKAQRIKKTIAALALSVGKLALDKTIRTLTSGVVELKSIIEAYSETVKNNSQFINTFREQFGKLKEEILKESGADIPRLFVFIDDLDRCTPDNCIMVLEAIKLFFDLPECVFIIGIDRVVVQKGIEQKYKSNIGIHGQDYVDKLIQLPLSLPPIRGETFEHYIRSITVDFNFSSEILALIKYASDSNPRRAKRLSNCLQLTRNVAERLRASGQLENLDTPLDENQLALLLTLQVRYPVAYLWLTRHPRTFQELKSGWETLTDDERKMKGEPGKEDGGPVRPGYRHMLINFMKNAYGEEIAEQTADNFLRLWQYAESREIGVEPFATADQLKESMRITGIVDDTSLDQYSKNRPPTARESLDSLYTGEELIDDEEAEEKTVQQEGPEKESPDLDDVHEKQELLLSDSREIIRKWGSFTSTSVVTAFLHIPGMMRRAENILGAKQKLEMRIENLVNLAGGTKESRQAFWDVGLELEDITFKKTYRYVASIASTFAIVWPLAMAFIGAGAELLFKIAVGEKYSDAYPSVLLFGTDMDFSNFFYDVYKQSLYEKLLEIPKLFPGGALFFWFAVLYSLFAVFIWRKAKNNLKKED